MSAAESLGRAAVAWAADMLVWTALLLIAARLLDRLLTRRVAPGWRMLLYLAIPIRLALPSSFATPVGLGDAVVVHRLLGEMPQALGGAGAAAVGTVGSAASWGTLAVAVYIAGLVALAVSWLRRHGRGDERIVDGTTLGAGPYCVAVTPDRGPEAVGIVRPRIVLPLPLVEATDPARLRWIVRHERAHLERRDPATLAAVQLTTLALWPLVPVWLAAARIRALIEMACDARALAGSDPAERTTYLETLLMPQLHLTRRRHPLVPVAVAFARGGLAERVNALRPTRRWPRAVQASLALAAACGLAACSALSDSVDDRVDDTVAVVIAPTALEAAAGAEAGAATQVLLETRVIRAGSGQRSVVHGALDVPEGARIWVVRTLDENALQATRGVRTVIAPSLVTQTDQSASIFVGRSVELDPTQPIRELRVFADGLREMESGKLRFVLAKGDSTTRIGSGMLLVATASAAEDGAVPLQVRFVMVDGGRVTRQVDGSVDVPEGQRVILLAAPPAKAQKRAGAE